MRRMGGLPMAVAEWVVGLLVLLYIVWGMCYDHLLARHMRDAPKATPEPEPGPPRRCGRRRSRRTAAALAARDGRRFLLN